MLELLGKILPFVLLIYYVGRIFISQSYFFQAEYLKYLIIGLSTSQPKYLTSFKFILFYMRNLVFLYYKKEEIFHKRKFDFPLSQEISKIWGKGIYNQATSIDINLL